MGDLWNRERTGWRDEWISKRHRHWGVEARAVDIDFLVVEFTQGVPYALIEYKSFHASTVLPWVEHPKYRAIAVMANRASLPFLIVRYWPNAVFEVIPVNALARKHFSKTTMLSEYAYVKWLYTVRQMELPGCVAADCSTEMIPGAA